MPAPAEFRNRHGRDAEDMGFEMVLMCTQALFKSRRTLTDSCFDHAMRTCKTIVRRTSTSEQVRLAIGTNTRSWKDINDTFVLALPVLESQSLPPEDTQNGTPILSSNLMASNHGTLMKDLERLNDILLIARNVLATIQKVQNLAGESLVDQQVLKFIDLCVRVTARGYDGETGTRTEVQWGDIMASCELDYQDARIQSKMQLMPPSYVDKKLLITCLQFLYNFIQENEQRKLLLWLDLFANSRVQSDYTAGTFPPDLEGDDLPAKLGDTQSANGTGNVVEEIPDPTESVSRRLNISSKQLDSPHGDALMASLKLSDQTGLDFDAVKESLEQFQQLNMGNRVTVNDEKTSRRDEGKPGSDIEGSTILPPQSLLRRDSSGKPIENDMLFGAVKADNGDEFGALRTPESAAVTLQAAKDQLMARLADTAPSTANEEESDNIPLPNDGDTSDQDHPPSDDEDEYQSQGDGGESERGLLTDIPLVLGPQEIEALPMIIQIAICSGQGAFMHGRDMQGMRCNILLAGNPGRNLLRELLIFIAAWDLQDDEMYFKLMMQIMEAILENGLMPYAYQTFAEVKDIVSPAQSMVIKLLTQIFRGKQALAPITGKDSWTVGNVHATASRRVDIYIVRYIFTIFRQCIIPETCALIYLQGQIKGGLALPEDFPLNMWDMERVYEGVYQFLEFFAVLTESEEWKGLLVDWEIVNELVTLLRELESSIPKASLSVSQTVAGSQQMPAPPQPQQAQPPPSKPAPVAVERPFDLGPPLPPGERPFDGSNPTDARLAAPSPISQSDSQDQNDIEAADPSDFEWRNLKKLVILVLSSLVWKSPTVQNQIRHYGGVEMVLACCTYDGNNPYIREHAVMCLRFLLENSEENKELVRNLERVGMRNGDQGTVTLRPPESTGRQSQITSGVQPVSPHVSQ